MPRAATPEAPSRERLWPSESRLLHVAVIMDGNGRWAQARGLPRSLGHRRGARAARRAIEAAPGLGIGTLTLYAFSCDNWRRPAGEVAALMDLFESYLGREPERAIREGVRLSVIGRRDRLRPSLLEAIRSAEERTLGGTRLHLRLAVDYSGREAILAAASRCGSAAGGIDRPRFRRDLLQAMHSPLDVPDVDLVIRTGGEKRLSDFLLWESAYAELWFTDCPWPEFEPEHLERAVADFHGRDRRFGAVDEGPVYRCDSTSRTSSRMRRRNLKVT